MRTRLIVVLAVAFILSSCGGDGATDAPSAARSTAAAPPASPAADKSDSEPAKESGPSRLVLQEGVITQSNADYTTKHFQPRATFHTPGLAYPFFPNQDAPRALVFDTEAGGLVIARPAQVFDPASGKLVAPPADLTEWATSNENVDASASEPVRLAGTKGTQVTGEVTLVGRKEGDCELPCIRFAPMGSKSSMWFAKGDKFRLVSITVRGEAIGMVIVSDRAGFGQINDAADQLLKTLRFH